MVVCLYGDLFRDSNHGKSPLHHHLGEYFWNFFPSIKQANRSKGDVEKLLYSEN